MVQQLQMITNGFQLIWKISFLENLFSFFSLAHFNSVRVPMERERERERESERERERERLNKH